MVKEGPCFKIVEVMALRAAVHLVIVVFIDDQSHTLTVKELMFVFDLRGTHLIIDYLDPFIDAFVADEDLACRRVKEEEALSILAEWTLQSLVLQNIFILILNEV